VQNKKKIIKNTLFEILAGRALLKNLNWGYVRINEHIGFWSLWKCQKSIDMPILQ
jgi:hypothetical protein